MEMTLHHPPTTTQTQCQQYLSCSRPDFNQTFNISFWDQQEQQHEHQQQQQQKQERVAFHRGGLLLLTSCELS